MRTPVFVVLRIDPHLKLAATRKLVDWKIEGPCPRNLKAREPTA